MCSKAGRTGTAEKPLSYGHLIFSSCESADKPVWNLEFDEVVKLKLFFGKNGYKIVEENTKKADQQEQKVFYMGCFIVSFSCVINFFLQKYVCIFRHIVKSMKNSSVKDERFSDFFVSALYKKYHSTEYIEELLTSGKKHLYILSITCS